MIMIIYILCVLIIFGAIVVDHYKGHLYLNEMFNKLKSYIIKEYKFRTRDKFAGLRAMDEYENWMIEGSLSRAKKDLEESKKNVVKKNVVKKNVVKKKLLRKNDGGFGV